MNLEIEVPGLKLKLEYIDKKQMDRTILAVLNFAKGGSFEEVYQATNKVEEPQEKKPKNYTPHVNGIKTYSNGKVAYKCSYNCGCGNRGERFIAGDEEHVHCHECNGKLMVSPSTLNDAHDEDYNYFLAY